VTEVDRWTVGGSGCAAKINDMCSNTDRAYGYRQRRHKLSWRKRRGTGTDLTDLHVALARQVAASVSPLVLVFVMMGVLLRCHPVVGMSVRSTRLCVSRSQ
jgi:hypothetical protein